MELLSFKSEVLVTLKCRDVDLKENCEVEGGASAHTKHPSQYFEGKE